MVPELREPPLSVWEGAAVDTVHLTFRASLSVGGVDLAEELQGLIDAVGLSGGATPRNRGLHGFEQGLTFASGLRLDWTDGNGEGPNPGFSSLQVKGDFFKQLGPEESTLSLLLLNDLKPYRCTRLDAQMTHCTGPLVPEIIRLYRAGLLKTKQKKHFEPKGKEMAGGQYPEGATLTHGSRKSENYARQYDKHLQQLAQGSEKPGPPRRRDEVELKGATAQAVWKDLVLVLSQQLEEATPNWMAEAAFCKGLIRHYLPIRDVSQWEGKDLPTNWAGVAPEPAWWTTYFSEEAIRARRERGPSSTLLKRIGYMNRTFGSLYTQQFVLEQLKAEEIYEDVAVASDYAQCVVRDRMFSNAKDYRLEELLENLPVAKHDRARELWWSAVRAAADGNEAERDQEGK
jgi:hypothetical protein